MTYALFIFMAISGLAWARPNLVLKLSSQGNADVRMLEQEFETAAELFNEEVIEFNGEITAEIAPAHCLRTGYDRSKQSVIFCPGPNVIEMGLQSADVIHHELFHALLCQSRPSLCQVDKKESLHEALADYFAYKLMPDKSFGEGFYRNLSAIRDYQTDWRPGLVQGTHEQGSALAAIFIKEKRHIKDLLVLFNEPESPEEVSETVHGVPFSRLNRYRLEVGTPMQIDFHFADRAKVQTVKWVLPEGVKATAIGSKSFQIEVTRNIEASKAYAKFLSAEGKELGTRTYYFGVARNDLFGFNTSL